MLAVAVACGEGRCLGEAPESGHHAILISNSEEWVKSGISNFESGSPNAGFVQSAAFSLGNFQIVLKPTPLD
jgi:hypothetical protein